MNLLERLAELEHNQWMSWTKEVIELNRNSEITNILHEQWSPSWIPYSELTEGQKELDRVHARKVMNLLNEFYKEKILEYMNIK